MAGIVPTGITANRNERWVQIGWSDGHSSIYSFSLMRAACPCASCRGGHDKMGPEPDPEVFGKQLPESSETRLKRLEAVGSYAITIEWEDGHHYGIYNWHYLRALCPCAQCHAESQP